MEYTQNMRKLHALTLTEVMISLGLFSVVLASVFSSFRNSTILQTKAEAIRKDVLQRSSLLQRLSNVFLYVDTKSFKQQEDGSIRFSFDNQIDPEGEFAGMIEAHLYLDDRYDLILESFSKKKDRSRKEILLSDILEVTFERDERAMVMIIDRVTYPFFFPKTDQQGFLL